MIPLLLLFLTYLEVLEAQARPFNITELIVPEVVPPNQNELEIECRYDANFTLLSWFKGPNEFFRYRPGTAPSIMTFPVLGVGKIDIITCGPIFCRLRLGSLNEDATGLYRCDIERDVPPYKFEARSAHMQVHGHQARRPLLEELAEEFGEDDEMLAYCRAAPGSQIRWYINAREIKDMRGSPTFHRSASRLFFRGIPPTVAVQCAEFRYGTLLGSKEAKARWKNRTHKDERPQEQRNNATRINAFLMPTFFLIYFTKLLIRFFNKNNFDF